MSLDEQLRLPGFLDFDPSSTDAKIRSLRSLAGLGVLETMRANVSSDKARHAQREAASQQIVDIQASGQTQLESSS